MRRGFTLAELMVVISVISMTALVLVPAAGDDRGAALRGATEMLAADIEDTQARMLADPLNPTTLFVNAEGDGWHLARTSTPLQPILGRDGLPRARRFGDGALAHAGGLRLETPTLPGGGLSFDDQGAPVQSDGELKFTLRAEDGNSTMGVLISASTGSVKISFE